MNEEHNATLKAYIVRCDHEVAEAIAHGVINVSYASEPTTPRSEGFDLIDEGHEIRLGHEAQRMHVEFGMDGDMRNIDHETEHVYLLVVTTSPDPIAMSLEVHDLGITGPAQEILALVILICVFTMIVFEVRVATTRFTSLDGAQFMACVVQLTPSAAAGRAPHSGRHVRLVSCARGARDSAPDA